jgi:hypothetical protein
VAYCLERNAGDDPATATGALRYLDALFERSDATEKACHRVDSGFHMIDSALLVRPRANSGTLDVVHALHTSKEEVRMRKTSLAIVTGAAILAAVASAHAQSATPTEGNPPAVRPVPAPPATAVRPAPPATTGAAPNSAAPNSGATSHMPGGNPDRAPGSTQTHEPPAK